MLKLTFTWDGLGLNIYNFASTIMEQAKLSATEWTAMSTNQQKALLKEFLDHVVDIDSSMYPTTFKHPRRFMARELKTWVTDRKNPTFDELAKEIVRFAQHEVALPLNRVSQFAEVNITSIATGGSKAVANKKKTKPQQQVSSQLTTQSKATTGNNNTGGSNNTAAGQRECFVCGRQHRGRCLLWEHPDAH
eukprot:gene38193-61644_t